MIHVVPRVIRVIRRGVVFMPMGRRRGLLAPMVMGMQRAVSAMLDQLVQDRTDPDRTRAGKTDHQEAGKELRKTPHRSV
jgi:hypothetical protein